MIKVLFLCHGMTSFGSEKSSKIKGFRELKRC